MAKSDITLSREDAEELRELVIKARNAIHKVNPSLSSRLDVVVMALHANLNDPEKLPEKDPDEVEPEPTPDIEPDEPNSKEWEPDMVDAGDPDPTTTTAQPETDTQTNS